MSPNETLEAQDELTRVGALLGELPAKQCEALLLQVCDELSIAEIAAKLQASATAVKQWIHRARTCLREDLRLDPVTPEPGEDVPLPYSIRQAMKALPAPLPLGEKERGRLDRKIAVLAGLPPLRWSRRPTTRLACAGVAFAAGFLYVWLHLGQRALPFLPPPPPSWPGAAGPVPVRYTMTSDPKNPPPPPPPTPTPTPTP